MCIQLAIHDHQLIYQKARSLELTHKTKLSQEENKELFHKANNMILKEINEEFLINWEPCGKIRKFKNLIVMK